MAIPTKDSLLAGFSTNMNARLVAQPGDYNLTPIEAAAYTALHNAWMTAWNAVVAAHDSGTRSSSLVAAKDLAKFNLLRYAREIYADVQASGTISNSLKIELGVRVRSAPTPRPAPATAPGITVVSVSGNTVRLRLQDTAHPTRRARPAGTDGAAVFSFVGAAAPTDETDWHFEGNTTRVVLDITLPAATPPGAKVFFTAWWFNPRAQRGPAAAPVSTNIPGGAAMAA